MTTPHAPAPVEDVPGKPYKAIAGFAAPAILAFLQSILDDGKPWLPAWAQLLIGGVMAGVAVYVVKNPKRVKRHHQSGRLWDHRGAVDVVTVLVVVVLVILVLVLVGVLH